MFIVIFIVKGNIIYISTCLILILLVSNVIKGKHECEKTNENKEKMSVHIFVYLEGEVFVVCTNKLIINLRLIR